MGCDGIIGSRVKFDRCGVCDGDGSTCLNGVEKSIVPEAANSGMSVALNSLKDIGFDLGTLYGKSSLSLAEEKRSGIPHHGDFVWARIKSGCPVSCGGGEKLSRLFSKFYLMNNFIYKTLTNKNKKTLYLLYPRIIFAAQNI